MELLDVYDGEYNKTGKTIERENSDKLGEGEYIAVGGALLINGQGQILLSKRSDNKSTNPGLWELNGGCFQAGEEPSEGIAREVREEIGVHLNPENGVLLKRTKTSNFFKELWAFRVNVKLSDLVFDPREVAEAKWIEIDNLITLREMGKMQDSNKVSVEDYEKALDLLGIKSQDSHMHDHADR